MPEIGEVARVVHYLQKNLVGRRILSVLTQEDDIVYGKVGTSAGAFQAALKGKTVVGARQQGKYFWLEMSSPPHPLMHLGMTGWFKFSNEQSKPEYKPSSRKVKEDGAWPPKYWKFVLQMDGEPACEGAFVDSRRLARIRLVDVPAAEMRNTSPLKENGPDPVVDKDVLTEDWFKDLVLKKKVPIKALLLNQANISGVGNWVADEVLYNARIHPEQYSNTLDDAQLAQLYKSLMYVCDFACEVLSDSSKFPEDWLMKHRWGKGKKSEHLLANGDKIMHITVGGRTSAIVPSVQKKTGPVAGDVDAEDQAEDDGEESAQDDEAEVEAEQDREDSKASPKRGRPKPTKLASKGAKADKAAVPNKAKKRVKARKAKEDNSEAEEEEEDEDEDDVTAGARPPKSPRKRPAKSKVESTRTTKAKARKIKEDGSEVEGEEEEEEQDDAKAEARPTKRKREMPAKTKDGGTRTTKAKATREAEACDERGEKPARRRSARLSSG